MNDEPATLTDSEREELERLREGAQAQRERAEFEAYRQAEREEAIRVGAIDAGLNQSSLQVLRARRPRDMGPVQLLLYWAAFAIIIVFVFYGTGQTGRDWVVLIAATLVLTVGTFRIIARRGRRIGLLWLIATLVVPAFAFLAAWIFPVPDAQAAVPPDEASAEP